MCKKCAEKYDWLFCQDQSGYFGKVSDSPSG